VKQSLSRLAVASLALALAFAPGCAPSSGTAATGDAPAAADAWPGQDSSADTQRGEEPPDAGVDADVLAPADAGTKPFAPFADESTVALWLFDETPYPYTTLTDASPYEYDLVLMEAGVLSPGKFGHALRVAPSNKYNVSYAGWQGDMINEHMKAPKGQPSGLWGPTGEPRRVLDALGAGTFTLEIWLKLTKVPASEAVVLDLGDATLPGLGLRLLAGAGAARLVNHYAGVEASCPTDAAALGDLGWHHLAFTSDAGAVQHYLDGVLQPQPQKSSVAQQAVPGDSQPKNRSSETRGFSEKSAEEWRREHRFNVALGEDRKGAGDLEALLDELRISDVVRYTASFAPASFSRNHGASPPQAAKPGLPLLFAKTPPATPVPLGARKHVFIDDALIETKSNVTLALNPVTVREDLTLAGSAGAQPFTPLAGRWHETILDHAGKVYLFIPDNYGSSEGLTRLFTSTDGLSFSAPNLGVIDYKGSTQNNFIFKDRPMGATVFKDENPAVSAEERFKVTAFASNRGQYLYVSPDLLHWRRNETLALPLASGGCAEGFWDDQRGLYVMHFKRDSSFNTVAHPGYGRRGVMFKTSEPFRPWPFKVLAAPLFDGWPFPSVTGEGPVTFPPRPIVPYVLYYNIFRTRAIKYPFAPDTYVALFWAGYNNALDDTDPDYKRRRVRLAVSRDGESWTFFDNKWYIDSVGQVNGKPARDALSFHGLIRRGDELWHYAEFTTENDGDGDRQYSRLKQRLDGFVSLDAAGGQTGLATTYPLTFQGSRLELNVKAKGSVRVALLDAQSKPIAGHGLADCKAVSADSVHHVVSWSGGPGIAALAGKTVRLRFELKDAKLYAFQFVP
jgi:hypothetical protein